MIVDKIKQALKKRGLSARKMITDLEIREHSVYDFLSGKRKNIGIKSLEKILKYLEIDLVLND